MIIDCYFRLCIQKRVTELSYSHCYFRLGIYKRVRNSKNIPKNKQKNPNKQTKKIVIETYLTFLHVWTIFNVFSK